MQSHYNWPGRNEDVLKRLLSLCLTERLRTIKTMDLKEMGICPRNPPWEKKKAPRGAGVSLKGISCSSNNVVKPPYRMRLKPRQRWSIVGQWGWGGVCEAIWGLPFKHESHLRIPKTDLEFSLNFFVPLPNVGILNTSSFSASCISFHSFSGFIEEGWPDLTWGTGCDPQVW